MSFNLVSDPWIPVRFLDGTPAILGLADTFQRAAEIADLSAPVHERISLMRLLVCITQAALGAPEEPDEWEDWGSDLAERTTAYLASWHQHFNLFGEGPRFLQRRVEVKKAQRVAKIVFELGTGNTSLLFDHTGEDDRNFQNESIARAILAYQNHFIGGSMGQAPEFRGEKGIAGPAINALHAILQGNTLHKTIILNCLDTATLGATELGRPGWETDPNNSYLGRLVPQPCDLWLEEGAQWIRIAPGHVYPLYSESGAREPTTTLVSKKIKGSATLTLLRASIGRGIWRDLHCITVLSREEQKAPLSFVSHYIDRHSPEVRFWAGELIKAKDAKILDAMESSFTVPWALFTQAGQQRYQDGVRFAEFIESRLKAALFIYGKSLKHENVQTEAARRHYWHTLDQSSPLLLELLEDAGTENDPLGSASFGKGKDPWTQLVRKAARDAYAASCPCTTPRQHKAFVAGLKQLHSKPAKASKKTTAKS